ncbi:ankyrin repeat domain-containing protein 39-like isoform X1 [Pseudochaenichthys georgianus]|uniref:ankyrin repeat domain-containing protein 39-like isoform X1 n=1 Tax=Pseudochaenichthys georgianus TaxID=52239 RepID=UPI00146AD5C2|nr:ankyrin repeat domain-containing protein 39-like isoform X1 [Pseudochaenichthys georgianus]
MLLCTMATDIPQCSCCINPVSSPSVYQTLSEMDFERGIWSAAMDGDLERVKSLTQKGTDSNLRDSTGYTALVSSLGIFLCAASSVLIHLKLLHNLLCVLSQHYASRSGHHAVCKFLLESGACASPQTPGGATPLHRSAYCGHLDVVRLLLQHRADPMLCDDDGSSPLHKAAEQSHEEVCLLLMESCAALCSQANNRLLLPFQLAPQGDLQELLKPPHTLRLQTCRETMT